MAGSRIAQQNSARFAIDMQNDFPPAWARPTLRSGGEGA